MIDADKDALLLKRYRAVRGKVDRYIEARRIAEEAFDRLRESPDWARICELSGSHPSSDFGDWSC